MSARTWADNVLVTMESIVRAAVPTLPAGTAGWEIGQRPFEKLDTSEFPHVFNSDYTETRTLLDFAQEEVRAAWILQLWTYNETMSALLAKVDDIDSGIRGQNWALVVELQSLHIASLDVIEHMAKPYKVALIGVEFLEVSV